MHWHNDNVTNSVRAVDPAYGLVLSVTEAGDGWWAWQAVYDGTPWTSDSRWFATRVEAQDAAEEWAATLAEKHLGFFRRQPDEQRNAA